MWAPNPAHGLKWSNQSMLIAKIYHGVVEISFHRPWLHYVNVNFVNEM